MRKLAAWARALLGLDLRPDHHAAPLTVLLVTASESDRAALEWILSNTRWRILSAGTCAEALELLRSVSIPVVLCDRDLPGRDWRESMGAVLQAPHPVCVILASRVADSYLWDEVVRRGGFDVVTKPFQREAVLQALEFAWSHWKAGWVRWSRSNARA